MGTIVNLNRVRKRLARSRAENEANTNRIKFGRMKAEKTHDEMSKRLLDNKLEQHLIDREDQS